MELEHTDSHFHDSVPSTWPAGKKHAPVGSLPEEIIRGVVYISRLPTSFLPSQRLSDSSVSFSTLFQAVNILLSHRAHVFLKKDDVL